MSTTPKRGVAKWVSEHRDCPTCEGTGLVDVTDSVSVGVRNATVRYSCWRCFGNGYVARG